MSKWLFMSLLMSLLQQVPSVSALPTCNINWISPQVNTNSQFQVTWTFDLDNVGEDELLASFQIVIPGDNYLPVIDSDEMTSRGFSTFPSLI